VVVVDSVVILVAMVAVLLDQVALVKFSQQNMLTQHQV